MVFKNSKGTFKAKNRHVNDKPVFFIVVLI